MVGGAGYAVGSDLPRAPNASNHGTPRSPTCNRAKPRRPRRRPHRLLPARARRPTRIEALTKLESLLDYGVLTQEQYESERQRLTQGM